MSKRTKSEDERTPNEDRKFQLEMLKVQLRLETNTALYLGMIALGYSLMVGLLPLLYLAEVELVQKFGIYFAIIIVASMLIFFVFQFKNLVKAIEINIEKLEKEYIET